ncbi:PEGA domain-containing protein [Myxococcus sp. K38C18041901]|uniref:PEGA domain-containing protein n=1 Tax=Myxococcus guangdongensis TaxID=2906760 RepID=UPI0020A73B04|nr:PEGA domain-containing protein [Myxococcus guangdongensis]MCP3061852.1 PEGA domain-containing protein [Myxococcus guangdongensis]
MSIRRLVLFSLVAVLAAPSSALAQADDLLAPLTPSKSATKKPAKPKVVKKKKAEKAAAAKKPPKAATAKGSKKKNIPPPDDSLLAPLAPVKTELAVAIAGGVRGARLTLDGRDAGALSAAPMTVPVAPGDHLLVVRKAGYEDYTRRFTVKEGSTQDVKVALVATMGFARAMSDVAGTKVLVDDVELGTVPLSDILLKPGSREIEFRAEGFRPDIQRINVLAGTNYELVGKMRPLVDTAVASNTPREDVPTNPVLDPSTTSQGDDYNPALAFNEKSPDAELEGSSKPWYGRWYVWAGVGAVVAAGTVGAVMATKDPGITKADPLTACGGPCDVTLGGVRQVRGNGGAQKLAPVGGLSF